MTNPASAGFAHSTSFSSNHPVAMLEIVCLKLADGARSDPLHPRPRPRPPRRLDARAAVRLHRRAVRLPLHPRGLPARRHVERERLPARPPSRRGRLSRRLARGGGRAAPAAAVNFRAPAAPNPMAGVKLVNIINFRGPARNAIAGVERVRTINFRNAMAAVGLVGFINFRAASRPEIPLRACLFAGGVCAHGPRIAPGSVVRSPTSAGPADPRCCNNKEGRSVMPE
jgi:hypothetical protein